MLRAHVTKFQDGSPLITNDSISEQRFNLIENGFVWKKRDWGFQWTCLSSVNVMLRGKSTCYENMDGI